MEVHVELLLGKRVRDSNGRIAGRILAVRAVKEGAHCFVTGYQLGAAALLTRLGISSGRLIGMRLGSSKVVPWQQMVLSDPDRPRLKVPLEQLKDDL